jgi:hypothetical protein
VEGGAIYLRVDGNGGDSHFVAGTNDPHGDLAAIRDENFLEHFPEPGLALGELKILQEIPGSNTFTANGAKKSWCLSAWRISRRANPPQRTQTAQGIAVWVGMCL